jgi:hypothetical protein
MNDAATTHIHTLSARTALTARRSVAAFTLVIFAAVITACGSSNRPSSPAAGGGPLLQYARCVRAHGVPNFPDPSAHAGLVIPNDINPQSPAFESAQQACATLAQPPEGQGGSSASRKLELLALARCMRAHGVANFPDPTNSPPPPSSGNAVGGDGSYLAIGTRQERESPAYKRAAAACGGIP